MSYFLKFSITEQGKQLEIAVRTICVKESINILLLTLKDWRGTSVKKSNYNFFYEYADDSNKLIAYNSRTNALAMIEKNDYVKYESFDDNNVSIDDNNVSIDDRLVNDLKRGGFLVEDSINELKLLRYNMLSNRHSSQTFALTIAPTLDCDFACVYCYEEGKKHGYILKEVQEAIVKSIENQTKFVEGVNITWHGGEPLLALDIIENITKQVLQICEKNDMKYSAGIITNGYNLTKNSVLKLKELKIGYLQITLDGTEKIHNSRRPLRNGGPTFEKILNNIQVCKELLPRVSLRVNVDKENQEDMIRVLDVIREFDIQDIVTVYPGYVEPTNSCYSKNNCLEYSDFAKLEYKFHNALLDEKLVSNITYKYPYLRSNVCGADNASSFVVDPKGNLCKCWSDIGRDEYSINNLLDFKSTNTNVLLDYMLYDPTMDEECRECSVLPLCMGGCPRRRIDKIVDRCSAYKYVLEDYIQQIADQKQVENKSHACSCC